MTTDVVPPLFPPREGRPNKPFPDPDRPLGRAWASAYKTIAASSEPVDGVELAHEVAKAEGLAPVTMIGLLGRAAANGLLVSSMKVVTGTRGPRPRAHYKVPA